MNRKEKEARIVTFAKDHNPSGKRVLYEKGKAYAMHWKTVEIIKKQDTKSIDSVESLSDEKVSKIVNKAKAAKKAAEKEE